MHSLISAGQSRDATRRHGATWTGQAWREHRATFRAQFLRQCAAEGVAFRTA